MLKASGGPYGLNLNHLFHLEWLGGLWFGCSHYRHEGSNCCWKAVIGNANFLKKVVNCGNYWNLIESRAWCTLVRLFQEALCLPLLLNHLLKLCVFLTRWMSEECSAFDELRATGSIKCVDIQLSLLSSRRQQTIARHNTSHQCMRPAMHWWSVETK